MYLLLFYIWATPISFTQSCHDSLFQMLKVDVERQRSRETQLQNTYAQMARLREDQMAEVGKIYENAPTPLQVSSRADAEEPEEEIQKYHSSPTLSIESVWAPLTSYRACLLVIPVDGQQFSSRMRNWWRRGT